MAINIGHIDPEMAYWTDIRRVRVHRHPVRHRQRARAAFAGALVFETIRSFAYEYSPNTWQMVLGVTMLVIMIFLPGGLWSLFARRRGG